MPLDDLNIKRGAQNIRHRRDICTRTKNVSNIYAPGGVYIQ
jgi:hypothetical protein